MPLAHRLTAPVAVALTVAALLLTGGLAGCSIGDDPASASGGGGGGKASFDEASKPLVKGTFDSPAARGAKVDIAILGLRVKGRLATLGVQIVPNVPGAEDGRINPYGLNGERGLDTSLIDPVNLKRYVVVSDSAGNELESDDIFTHLSNGQPTNLSYTFAAPPENVKSIDVQIGSWPMFRNIPVER